MKVDIKASAQNYVEKMADAAPEMPNVYVIPKDVLIDCFTIFAEMIVNATEAISQDNPGPSR